MPLRECIQRELTKRQNFKSRFSLKYVAGNRVPVSLSSFFRVCVCTLLPLSVRTIRPATCVFFFKVEMHLHAYVRMPRANILCVRPSDEMDTWSQRGGFCRKVIRCFYSGSVKSELIPVALSLSLSVCFYEKFVKKRRLGPRGTQTSGTGDIYSWPDDFVLLLTLRSTRIIASRLSARRSAFRLFGSMRGESARDSEIRLSFSRNNNERRISSRRSRVHSFRRENARSIRNGT